MFERLSYHKSCRRLLLAILVIAAVGCRSDASSSSNNWVLFESKEGNFKVMFPDQPIYKASSDGNAHQYTWHDATGRVLRVAYRSGFDPSIQLEDRFNSVQSSAKVNGIIQPKPISLGQHAGLEAIYEMQESENNPMQVHHRIFHVGSTFYQLLAVAPREDDVQSDVERFFASFQLLSP